MEVGLTCRADSILSDCVHRYILCSTTSVECPGGVSLCSLPAETGTIIEHCIVKKEGKCNSGIHWQVIHVHKVQNGLRTGPREMPAVIKRAQEYATLTLTLRVPLGTATIQP